MRIILYHMTHIQNLPSIIDAKVLYCDQRVQAIKARSIAYVNFKEKRRGKPVPVPPGGVIADYVPFYFAPCSPMLYAIHTGCVDSSLTQSEIVYLTTTIEAIAKAGKRFVFTDCHPLSPVAHFNNDLDLLNRYVDWNVMRSAYWHDTPEYPHRKSRRQAEFLVHQTVEWTLIQHIGVYDQARLLQVNEFLAPASHKPLVSVQREWYYR
ncbi:MAG: DUF4433 domain-containing protein [Armatimonadetes bacterium]|nr:DUF4433 domain-containing protein [Armatimonadota bacterium]